MKNIRLIALITAFMLPLFTSCVKEAAEVSVEFAGSSYQLNVGGTLDLAAELKVSNSSKKPAWKSSDETVASVDASGTVTAISAGETSVRATVEGKEAVCSIIVKDVLAESIALTAPESLTADGSWAEIKAQVQPAGYNTGNLVWTFTPSTEALAFESEKVDASCYKVRFNAFVEGGSLSVKVSDRNSSVSQTVAVAAAEKVVPATKISLNMPENLTGGGYLDYNNSRYRTGRV